MMSKVFLIPDVLYFKSGTQLEEGIEIHTHFANLIICFVCVYMIANGLFSAWYPPAEHTCVDLIYRPNSEPELSSFFFFHDFSLLQY